MRLTAIALIAAVLPVIAVADQNKNQQEKDTQVQTDAFVWSTSQDSRLGVMVLGLNPELRNHFGAPSDAGLLVAKVAPDGPAARAGIRVGDVITKVGDDKIDSAGDVLKSISGLEGPQKVSIEIVRQNKLMTVQATLGRPRELSPDHASAQ